MTEAAPIVPEAPPAAATWTTGLEGELLGHAQNAGWDKLEPAAAAQAALKAHREAQKLIGVPADQVIKLPPKGDAPGWDGVWQRLGAPKEAKEYDFSAIKFADGKSIDGSFGDMIRATAFKSHLPKDAAVEFAKEVVKWTDAQDATDKTNTQAELLSEKAKLRDGWGKNYDAFEVVAKRTAEVLGVKPEAVVNLEKNVGYAAVMEMFYNIGTKIGEDSFIRNLPGSSGTGALSRDQAIARKADLMSDPAWVKRYNEGGTGSPEFKELQSLISIDVAGR